MIAAAVRKTARPALRCDHSVVGDQAHPPYERPPRSKATGDHCGRAARADRQTLSERSKAAQAARCPGCHNSSS
jgi:hypothetical protein